MMTHYTSCNIANRQRLSGRGDAAVPIVPRAARLKIITFCIFEAKTRKEGITSLHPYVYDIVNVLQSPPASLFSLGGVCSPSASEDAEGQPCCLQQSHALLQQWPWWSYCFVFDPCAQEMSATPNLPSRSRTNNA